MLDRLGEPGARRTFRAHDDVLDRDVVVKVLDAGDAQQRAHVLEEARAAGRIVHPHVATVLDVIADGDIISMVSELADGRPLPALLDERGRLGPAEAVEIASQIADALAAAHQQGLAHGALHPNSIVVTDDGIARLVDFGAARVKQATQSAGHTLVDARTDVYALGAILYELLTGEPPASEPSEPSRRNPSVPPDLDVVVLTALAPDPDRRYQNAALLRDALRNVGKRSVSDTQVMRRPVGAVGARPRVSGARQAASRPSATRPATPAPSAQVPPAMADPPRSGWTTAGQAPRGTVILPGAGRTSWLPRSRWVLWAVGVVAVLAALALALALFGSFGRSSGEATERWATFARPSCEWSNVTTPPGICFGERPAGYRVRILEQKGARWMVWDPTTQGPAYVDGDALTPE